MNYINNTMACVRDMRGKCVRFIVRAD